MNSETPLSNAPEGLKKGLLVDPLMQALDHDPTMELDTLFGLDQRLSQDTGISPSLINSQEASRALESCRSTPVLAPIERQRVPNLSSNSGTSEEQNLQSSQHANVPLPNLTPTTNPMSEEAEAVAAILDGQWSIFMKAWNLNNTHTMRTTLMQATSSQLLLQELVGFDKMMTMLDNWSAREELDKLKAQKECAPHTHDH
jgi:hypothetical protein